MRYFYSIIFIGILSFLNAQDVGTLNGSFEGYYSIFEEDSAIGTNTTQYYSEKSGSEAWLLLNYKYKGYAVDVRFDAFNNSPRINPQEAYTQQGLAFFSVSKEIGKLKITGGHFYDQFGSGLTFRAFEDRMLGLDYAIQGVKVDFTPTDKWTMKAFTGQQKVRFDVHPQVIKGFNTEWLWKIGNINMFSGASIVNRTLDRNTVIDLANEVNNLPVSERFHPKYNMFSGSIYNTLNWGNLSLFTEYAQKTKEALYIFAPDGTADFKNVDGKIAYGILNYSIPKLGLGFNLQYKYVDTFVMRTSPYTNLLVGLINYQPPLSRQQSLRLPARYAIAALAEGERGYQAEVTWSPNRNQTLILNTSEVKKLDNQLLYREYFAEYIYKVNRRLILEGGLQTVMYDQEVYQQKPLVPNVEAITPFFEFSYRLNPFFRKRAKTDTSSLANISKEINKLKPSIRCEVQYLRTEQDFGDFAWVLLELNMAPHYSISVSDMINTKPTKGDEILHFYTIFGAYNFNQTRFTLGYIKQVEGVVCTGGVCRVEPAFSGWRAGLTTNF